MQLHGCRWEDIPAVELKRTLAYWKAVSVIHCMAWSCGPGVMWFLWGGGEEENRHGLRQCCIATEQCSQETVALTEPSCDWTREFLSWPTANGQWRHKAANSWAGMWGSSFRQQLAGTLVMLLVNEAVSSLPALILIPWLTLQLMLHRPIGDLSTGVVSAWSTDSSGRVRTWSTDSTGVVSTWSTDSSGMVRTRSTDSTGEVVTWSTDSTGVVSAWSTDSMRVVSTWSTDSTGVVSVVRTWFQTTEPNALRALSLTQAVLQNNREVRYSRDRILYTMWCWNQSQTKSLNTQITAVASTDPRTTHFQFLSSTAVNFIERIPLSACVCVCVHVSLCVHVCLSGT